MSRNGNADVWARPLANGDTAVLLLNRGSTPSTVTTTAADAGLPPARQYLQKDLWTGDITENAGTFSAALDAHNAAVFRVSGSSRPSQYPPTTTLGAATGGTEPLVSAGRTAHATTTFADTGQDVVTDAKVSLAGPTGWTVSPTSETSAPVIRGDKQLVTAWTVAVPADATPGRYHLDIDAHFRWHGRDLHTGGGLTITVAVPPPAGSSWLSDLDWLDWLDSSNGYGPVVKDKNYYGGPLSIHSTVYPKGFWVNATSTIRYYLGQSCTRFTSDVGLDDSDHGTGTVAFQVFTDGQKAYDSGVVTNSSPTRHLDVSLTGAQTLELVVTDAGDGVTYDNADWAAPSITCTG